MCKCNPNIRAPFCGKIWCKPKQVTLGGDSAMRPKMPISMQIRRARAAIQTLQSEGYTWHGGEYWKPPLGTNPLTREDGDAEHY